MSKSNLDGMDGEKKKYMLHFALKKDTCYCGMPVNRGV